MTSKEEAAKIHELHRDIMALLAASAPPFMHSLSVAMSAMMTAVAIAKSIGLEHELQDMLDVARSGSLDMKNRVLRPVRGRPS